MLTSDLSSRPSPVQDQGYWREAITRFKASGLTQKQFCLQNELSLSTFKGWYYRLYHPRPKKEASGFAPIVLKDDATPGDPSPQKPQESDLILELPNAIRVIVSPDFGTETLRRLLSIVGDHKC